MRGARGVNSWAMASRLGFTNSEAPSYGDVVAEPMRRRSVPFCARCVYSSEQKLYRVRGLSDLAVMTRQREDHCTRCGHAVYWGRQFEGVDATSRRWEVAK